MKLIKFVPALAAALVLSACSQTTKMAESAANTMSAAANAITEAVVPATKTERVVAYTCNKKPVIVTYSFVGKDAVGATVMLGKKPVQEVLKRDTKNHDFTSFISENYIWNADMGLTLDTADKTEGVMLFKKGQKVDEILAKNCSINTLATTGLNK